MLNMFSIFTRNKQKLGHQLNAKYSPILNWTLLDKFLTSSPSRQTVSPIAGLARRMLLVFFRDSFKWPLYAAQNLPLRLFIRHFVQE